MVDVWSLAVKLFQLGCTFKNMFVIRSGENIVRQPTITWTARRQLKIACLCLASVLSLVDALGTLRGAGSSWRRPTSPLLPSLPVCFLFLIWAVSVLTETVQPGLFINSCKLEAAADRKGGGEMHFFSSSFFLHPAPSLPALLLPPPPFSLISCVKVSGAILASLDLCGSE